MADPVLEKVCHWDDIGYAAQLRRQAGTAVEFRVFTIIATDPACAFPGPCRHSYRRKEWNDSLDTVDTLDKAEVFVSGVIFATGCSDVNFEAQAHCLPHFCSREQAMDIGVLLGRLYDLARGMSLRQ